MSRYELTLERVGRPVTQSPPPAADRPLIDQMPPPQDLCHYLESFERSSPSLTLERPEPTLLHALNLRTLWAWARQETVLVPYKTYTALLEDHETLQADNARLRASLAQARNDAANAQAQFQRLDAEVASVIGDLIEPYLAKP